MTSITQFRAKNYLSRLIVKPNYRNKGIGGILIDFMIEKMKHYDYKEIVVGADKDNFAAGHLYHKKVLQKYCSMAVMNKVNISNC